MSFDLKTLGQAVEKHGQVCRLVVADVHGSGPREAGAAMLVWQGGQSGTIGGGALEFEAAKRALREIDGDDWVYRYALGPGLGQCCGGNVTVLAETYDAARLALLEGSAIIRRISGSSDMPDQFRHPLKSAEAQTVQMSNGWLLEPVLVPDQSIWIYGAGHVGRALVSILHPFPDTAITWVDTAADRFPPDDGLGPDRLMAANMADVVRFAPPETDHLILTFSHEIDLAICHAVLSHSFKSAGLIGSATKWRRFQKRLAELGHDKELIARITCPIGRQEFGKHPQAIAVGVASDFLSNKNLATGQNETMGDKKWVKSY